MGLCSSRALVAHGGWALGIFGALLTASVAGCGKSSSTEPQTPGSDASDDGAAGTGGPGGTGASGSGGAAGDAVGNGGNGGDFPTGGTNTGGLSGSAGKSSGGAASGGTASGGTGAGGSGGSGGSGAASVEYRACAINDQAVPRLSVFRADPTAGSCTALMFEAEGGGSCTLLRSGSWCLYQAHRGSDVEACVRRTFPMPSVAATSATGTFAVTAGSVDLDLSLVFPDSSEMVAVDAQDCRTDCSSTDCRR